MSAGLTLRALEVIAEKNGWNRDHCGIVEFYNGLTSDMKLLSRTLHQANIDLQEMDAIIRGAIKSTEEVK